MGEPQFYVFDGRLPSFDELANEYEAWIAAKDISPWRRLRYRFKAKRMRRAARWEFQIKQPLYQFLWHVGVLRYGMILGGTLGILVLTRAAIEGRSFGTDAFGDLLVLVVGGILIGMLFAVCSYEIRAATVLWAEYRRAIRVDIEQRLLSPDGYNGQRLERDPSGEWNYRDVESAT